MILLVALPTVIVVVAVTLGGLASVHPPRSCPGRPPPRRRTHLLAVWSVVPPGGNGKEIERLIFEMSFKSKQARDFSSANCVQVRICDNIFG